MGKRFGQPNVWWDTEPAAGPWPIKPERGGDPWRGLGDRADEGGDIADEGADPVCVPDTRFQGHDNRAERGGHQRL